MFRAPPFRTDRSVACFRHAATRPHVCRRLPSSTARSPARRDGIAANVDHLLEMTTAAVVGYRPLHRVELVVFPEFAWCSPAYERLEDLVAHLALPADNEHVARIAKKARELGVYIQAGSFLEVDPKHPGLVFNTTLLIGPEGVLSRYRKVNPWIPWEVHASPADLPGYDEPLFPVVDTEIGKLGVATCYDWLFPEVTRELAVQGAEVLIRISAYMNPWGATPPMDSWSACVEPHARAGEHGVRRRRQPRRVVRELPAVLVARRLDDRRLRRPRARAGRSGPRGEDRHRPARPCGPPRGARRTADAPTSRAPEAASLSVAATARVPRTFGSGGRDGRRTESKDPSGESSMGILMSRELSSVAAGARAAGRLALFASVFCLASCGGGSGGTPTPSCSAGPIRSPTPKFVKRFHAGVVKLEQHRFLDAAKTFDALTKARPNNLGAWINLAEAQLNRNTMETHPLVDAAIVGALKITDEPHAHFLRGILHKHVGEFPEAVTRFRAAMKNARPKIPRSSISSRRRCRRIRRPKRSSSWSSASPVSRISPPPTINSRR